VKRVAPLVGALLITAAEATARHVVRSRARALLLVYPVLSGIALVARRPRSRWPRTTPGTPVVAGFALALAGYPLGRWVMNDRGTDPPPDSLALDVVSLTVVAAVEEVIWGAWIENTAGIVPTAALFSAKHVAIDRRTGRALGLFAFWLGLGLVRRWSRKAALLLHVGSNAGGVLLGHATRRDQF
jgi:hypothetical protein